MYPECTVLIQKRFYYLNIWIYFRFVLSAHTNTTDIFVLTKIYGVNKNTRKRVNYQKYAEKISNIIFYDAHAVLCNICVLNLAPFILYFLFF